jgi:hypothetical protein
MYRISRRFISSLFLFTTLLSPLLSQERWAGPVFLDEFIFDRMEIYAIGWSEKGAFSYGVLTPGEKGSSAWQWYILDLIEDEFLYSSPRWTMIEGQTPGELWDLHPEWYSQLVRFNITPLSEFESGGQTFVQGADSYRMAYTLDRSESGTYPEGMTKDIRIDLYRNQDTAKTVYTYKPGSAENKVEDLILKGYVLSPYEKRTALVALEKIVNSEGPPQWVYRVIGAHLTIGFSRVQLGGSHLAEAVLNGHYYVSRLLLSEGADPDSVDSRGYSAILLAARLGHWSILSLLLESGAGVSSRDDRGRTALHYAVESGNPQLVSALLNRGADPDLKDFEGQSPRIMAGLMGNPSVMAAFP